MRGDALQDVLDHGYEVKPGSTRGEVNTLLVLALTRLEGVRRVAEQLKAAVDTMERPSLFITPEAAEALVYRVSVAEQGCRYVVERLEGIGIEEKDRTVIRVRGHDLAQEVVDSARDMLAAMKGCDLGPRVRACTESLGKTVGRFEKAEVGQ